SFSELLIDLDKINGGLDIRRQRASFLKVRPAVILSTIVLFVVAIAFTLSYFSSQNTVAVIPVINEHGDSNLDPECAQLTLDLVNGLSDIPKLKIKRADSIQPGYSAVLNSGVSGNADKVLTAQLRRRNQELWLHLTLINTISCSTMWSGDLPANTDQAPFIRQEVTLNAALQLQIALDERRMAMITKSLA